MPGRDEVRSVVEPVVEELGLELHRLDFAPTRGRAHLRLLIERPQGLVSIEDCTRVSGAVGRLLDGLDLVPCRYQLEVSSPGVDRALVTPRDFGRFAGSRVRVHLKAPPEEVVEPAAGPLDQAGTLRAYDPASDTLTLETDAGDVRIPRSAIARARLDPALLSPARPPRRGRP